MRSPFKIWRYRLMVLAQSGRVWTKISGNKRYVWGQAQLAKQARGRQWIDRTDAPMTPRKSS